MEESPFVAKGKVFERDAPAAGHVLLRRTLDRFRRSVNGAWIKAGSESTTYEIPVGVINSEPGSGWLNPGLAGFVALKFDDGSRAWVDGNEPIRSSGFGPLVELGSVMALTAHPRLPNLFPCFRRVRYFEDDVLATMKHR